MNQPLLTSHTKAAQQLAVVRHAAAQLACTLEMMGENEVYNEEHRLATKLAADADQLAAQMGAGFRRDFPLAEPYVKETLYQRPPAFAGLVCPEREPTITRYYLSSDYRRVVFSVFLFCQASDTEPGVFHPAFVGMTPEDAENFLSGAPVNPHNVAVQRNPHLLFRIAEAVQNWFRGQ